MTKIVIAMLLIAGLSGCIKDTPVETDTNKVESSTFTIYKVIASDGTVCYVAKDGAGIRNPLSMVCDFGTNK